MLEQLLPPFSDTIVDTGLILPGTGTFESFLFTVPSTAPSGEYTGIITVNASNTEAISIEVRVMVSQPPEQPNIIIGPGAGAIDKECTFSTVSNDPENGPLYYKWDWCNGEYSDWLGPFDSGETVSASHVWHDEGRYYVRVVAKDNYDILSEWSAPIIIDIINESEMKTAFLLGLRTNINKYGDFPCFNSTLCVYARLIDLDFRFMRDEEKVIVSKDFIGILREPLVFGWGRTYVI